MVPAVLGRAIHTPRGRCQLRVDAAVGEDDELGEVRGAEGPADQVRGTGAEGMGVGGGACEGGGEQSWWHGGRICVVMWWDEVLAGGEVKREIFSAKGRAFCRSRVFWRVRLSMRIRQACTLSESKPSSFSIQMQRNGIFASST